MVHVCHIELGAHKAWACRISWAQIGAVSAIEDFYGAMFGKKLAMTSASCWMRAVKRIDTVFKAWLQ